MAVAFGKQIRKNNEGKQMTGKNFSAIVPFPI